MNKDLTGLTQCVKKLKQVTEDMEGIKQAFESGDELKAFILTKRALKRVKGE